MPAAPACLALILLPLLGGCGTGGGAPMPDAELPTRGASGWPIDGAVVHEPAMSLSFAGDRLVPDDTSADADAGHPHEVGDAMFHTCGDSICRDGQVVLAPSEESGESKLSDPFVRQVTSPLGRPLWDMWYVALPEGASRSSATALSFAGSFDGYVWSRYPDNPILSPSGGVASPWVRQEPEGVALYVVTARKVVRRIR